MSQSQVTLADLDHTQWRRPNNKFVREMLRPFAERKAFRNIRKAPGWDERAEGADGYSRVRFYWERDGQYHRDNDLPAEVWSSGLQYWCRDGILHREHAPAQVDIWGDGKWSWNSYPASDRINTLLNLVYMDKNLTEEKALNYLELAKALDAEDKWYSDKEDAVTVVAWVATVIAKHPSKKISDEFRTFIGLRLLAGV